MNSRLRINIIALVGLICAILPLHGAKTFEDSRKEAIKIAQGMVAADKGILEKTKFEASFITFIEGLSDCDDNERFLNAIKSFKTNTRVSIKSLYNFISNLIYRVKVIHVECFVNLIKLLPQEYFSQHHFNWLRFSLKSGKIDYLTYLLDESHGTFSDDQLIKLYKEKPYTGLNSVESQGFYECCEFLRKRLKLKSDCSQSDEEDSESDEYKLHIVDDSSSNEGEQQGCESWSDQSDEEDSQSDEYKLHIIDDSSSFDGDA